MKKRINQDLINRYFGTQGYIEDIRFIAEPQYPIGTFDEYITTEEAYDSIEHLRFFIYFLYYSIQ